MKSSAEKKFKLVIAYDGTNYAGWQVQKAGVGVQEKIEAAFQQIFGMPCRLHSSSRTDAGVHALGMVAHVELPAALCEKVPLRKLPLALNSQLPGDIRILAARSVSKEFHARFDATGKQYRYYLWNHHAHNPLLRHQSWLVPQKLDLPAMRAGALVFEGTHDFKSFAGTRAYEMKTTIRTVTRCKVRKQGPLITFIIEGDGFLYKMCRGIVGTLVQVGLGKFQPAEIEGMLAQRDREVAGMTAPAHGLVLWRVYY